MSPAPRMSSTTSRPSIVRGHLDDAGVDDDDVERAVALEEHGGVGGEPAVPAEGEQLAARRAGSSRSTKPTRRLDRRRGHEPSGAPSTSSASAPRTPRSSSPSGTRAARAATHGGPGRRSPSSTGTGATGDTVEALQRRAEPGWPSPLQQLGRVEQRDQVDERAARPSTASSCSSRPRAATRGSSCAEQPRGAAGQRQPGQGRHVVDVVERPADEAQRLVGVGRGEPPRRAEQARRPGCSATSLRARRRRGRGRAARAGRRSRR